MGKLGGKVKVTHTPLLYVRNNCVGDNYNCVVACSEKLRVERAEWIIYEVESS